jgi:osmoprotectant transport system substrate-binding protein
VAAALACAALLGSGPVSCGLTSGSPLVDDVRPGSIGRGRPLKGASLVITSKNFSEDIILGEMAGLAFEAAGAHVLDRTDVTGSIGAREAVRSGQAQWRAVRDEDAGNGLRWLPPSTLDNTYSLAISRRANAGRHLRTLSDVAALSRRDPGAVTLCVENEFASRQDGLTGMLEAYGMRVPAAAIRKMDAGIIYTR